MLRRKEHGTLQHLYSILGRSRKNLVDRMLESTMIRASML
jgi:hypothetical protein